MSQIQSDGPCAEEGVVEVPGAETVGAQAGSEGVADSESTVIETRWQRDFPGHPDIVADSRRLVSCYAQPRAVRIRLI